MLKPIPQRWEPLPERESCWSEAEITIHGPYSCGCADTAELIATAPLVCEWRGRFVAMCVHGVVLTFLPLGDC